MSALIEDTDVAEGSEATIVALAHISATPQDGSVRYDADVHLNSETIGEIDETFEVLAFQHLGPKLEARREAWSSRLDDFKEVGPALKQLHQAVHQSFVAASQSDQGRTLNTKVYDSLNPEHREFFKDPEHVSVTRGTTPSARGTDPYLMVVQSIVLEMEGGSATRSEEPGRMIMTVTPGIRIALGAKDELNVSSSHSMFRDCTESWDDAKMEGLYPTTELWKKLNDQIDKKPLLDLIRANDPTATTTASKSLREAYRRKTVKLALEYSMTDNATLDLATTTALDLLPSSHIETNGAWTDLINKAQPFQALMALKSLCSKVRDDTREAASKLGLDMEHAYTPTSTATTSGTATVAAANTDSQSIQAPTSVGEDLIDFGDGTE
ncbi:hypothetical protein EHS25_008550 [Saitozyma podzolica]|uniref:Uncharacterized protein n=1 Tax=Saitozyma podzolica TaxID=1890683 RepID=A0A427YM20_9TREE|nr:hypothetical protein EHS25_008550 [Saitozyma podzolica]